MTKPANSTVDWERIEADYRAGLLSLREISSANPGANHVAIARRAKKEGWIRDLSAKIKAQADNLVTKQAVTEEVTQQRAVTDRQIVEVNAQVIANIRIAHRKDIQRFRALAISLLSELEAETGSLDLFIELGELLRKEDDKGVDKRNDLYMKVISSASRVDSAKKLAETLKILVGLEREAYGLVDSQSKEIAADNLASVLEQARKRVYP
ncbi:Putative bacteriophage protein [Collimonas arenae]|uniref:Putative bacteriophage protein n=1 Tax=Collimonas arenae TaxID=279058 RepID=A0A0A1F632_9BURK|nr:hypothetical protein [Collimonas arenae]AIY40168.1 Putative bacteriophage protein [Collimonas arenae]